MKPKIWLKTLLIGISVLLPLAIAADPLSQQTTTAAAVPLAVSPEVTLMEEGKVLYENGQLVAALGKFMTVLRRDSRNPEARQYLRMVIDEIRQNPAVAANSRTKEGKANVSALTVQEEVRDMLKKRANFTLDLKAIPGVQVAVKSGASQVEIDTPLLFAENSGGLKEQGIPILDRVAAWLKTYGSQPVIIHCYPEELQEASANGSLFLRRYSELYNFFVDERKLSPQRFVSADLLRGPNPPPPSSPTPPLRLGGSAGDSVAERGEENVIVSSAPRVIIETLGSQSAFLDDMPSGAPKHALSRWLELSIMATRALFNPEEGEWVSLDLAALTRTGLRSWHVKIIPAGAESDGKKVANPVFYLEGTGNLLKRLSWDGHDEKSGSFVPAGAYVARLVATDSDGTIMTRDVPLQVMRTTVEEPVVVAKKPEGRKAKGEWGKPKKTKAVSSPSHTPTLPNPPSPLPSPHPEVPEVASVPKTPVPAPAVDDSDSLVGSKSVGQTPPPPSSSPTGGEESEGDSVHAIWKQVVQFETGQSDLKPTVKASLERIGKTLEVYPLQKVRITGFAMDSEPNAAGLAKKRAETVRSVLIEQYNVDEKRVIVAGGKTTSTEGGSKVEMSITN